MKEIKKDNMSPKELIEKRIQEGISVEAQLENYKILKSRAIKEMVFEDAAMFRELEKECMRILGIPTSISRDTMKPHMKDLFDRLEKNSEATRQARVEIFKKWADEKHKKEE
jgi:hypothetical protein